MSPPDRQEKVIRFGCGALLGVAVGFYAVAKSDTASLPYAIALMIVVMMGLGYAALRGGDEFWWKFMNRARWWW